MSNNVGNDTVRDGVAGTGFGTGIDVATQTQAPLDSASLLSDAWRDMRRNPLFLGPCLLIILLIAMAIVPQLFAGWFGHGNPRACDLALSLDGPRSGHPFGFDTQGCDVYANVIYGARDSLCVGFLVTGLVFVVAVLIGSVSGLYGGWVDALISRISDVMFGFPFLLGALVILTSISARNVLSVALVLTFFGWPAVARVMRGSILTVRRADYVIAARSLGASDWRLVSRHILPNAIGPIIVLSTLNVGGYIVAEATLTFLGVGLQFPAISWGLQLSAAQGNFSQHPHLLLFPALFLALTVLSFVLLGDVLRDALDPRLR